MKTLPPEHNGSWVALQQDQANVELFNLVRSKYPAEVDALLRHEEDKKCIAGERETRLQDVQTKEANFNRWENELASPIGADFALTIFESAKSTGRPLRAIALEVCHLPVLRDSGERILQMARAELQQAKKDLDDFLKKNSHILAEVDRDLEARLAAYRTQIQVEQDKAAAKRMSAT